MADANSGDGSRIGALAHWRTRRPGAPASPRAPSAPSAHSELEPVRQRPGEPSAPPFLETLGPPNKLFFHRATQRRREPAMGSLWCQRPSGDLVKGDTSARATSMTRPTRKGRAPPSWRSLPAGAERTFAMVASLLGSDTRPGGIGLTTALSILARRSRVVVGSSSDGRRWQPSSCGTRPGAWIGVLNDTGWHRGVLAYPEHQRAVGDDRTGDTLRRRPLRGKCTEQIGGFAEDAARRLCTVVRIDAAIVRGRCHSCSGRPSSDPASCGGQQRPPSSSRNRRGARQKWQCFTWWKPSTTASRRFPMPSPVRPRWPPGLHAFVGWGAERLNGFTMAADGYIVAFNGNDGNAVQLSPQGRQIAKVMLVAHGAGDPSAPQSSPMVRNSLGR